MLEKFFSKPDKHKVFARKQIRNICLRGEEDDIPILCGLLSKYPEVVCEKVDDGFPCFDDRTLFEKSFLINELSPKISLAIWKMGIDVFDHRPLGICNCPEFLPILQEYLDRGGSPNLSKKEFEWNGDTIDGRSLLSFASEHYNYRAVEKLVNHKAFDTEQVFEAIALWAEGPYVSDTIKAKKNRPHLFSDTAALRTFSILNNLSKTIGDWEKHTFCPSSLWKKSILKSQSYKISNNPAYPLFLFHHEEKEAFELLQTYAKKYQSPEFYVWIIDEYCSETRRLLEDLAMGYINEEQAETGVKILYDKFTQLSEK